ncbi:hypothetical protein NRF20_13110 [Streptomyces sp. R-74717]|uniref:hypothetical protein n=1 Tax=Streptomyces TaxID=1883 RepID=UPI00379A3A0E
MKGPRVTGGLFVIDATRIGHRLLGLCPALDGAAAVPAQRKARREYENRVNLHAPTTDLGSQSRSAT